MKLTLTQYHYLMTLQRLSDEMDEVRCIDLAVELGVARATISRMMKYLMEQNLVSKNHRALSITEKGRQMMDKSSKQYETIYHYFSSMNLNAQEVKECTDALVNHISIQTLQKLCTLVKK